jgi:hypothetical protein
MKKVESEVKISERKILCVVHIETMCVIKSSEKFDPKSSTLLILLFVSAPPLDSSSVAPE